MTPGALHSELQRFLTSTFLMQTFYKLLHKHTACGTKHRNENSVQIVINLDSCIAFCRITNICLPSVLSPSHPLPNPFSFPATLLYFLLSFLPSILPSSLQQQRPLLAMSFLFWIVNTIYVLIPVFFAGLISSCCRSQYRSFSFLLF